MKYLLKRRVIRAMLSKTNFHGTGKVYWFSLRQMIKGKMNLFLLIFIVVAAFCVPMVSSFRNSSSEEATSVLTSSQQQIINSTIDISVQSVTEWQTEKSAFDEGDAYFIQYIYAIILMILSIMSSSHIMRTVVEEKSSRLVEFLMVSVRPLALLTGKILAAVTYVLLLLILSVMSLCVSSSLFGNTNLAIFQTLSSLRVSSLIFAMISILIAMIFLAILSGLCGSGCSTAEDLNSAMSVPMILIMGGYLVSIVVVFFDSKWMVLTSSLLPLLSSFCMPVQYALGRIGTGTVLISWLIQLFCVFLLTLLTAKVYAGLLIQRGRRISFGRILRFGLAGKGTDI